MVGDIAKAHRRGTLPRSTATLAARWIPRGGGPWDPAMQTMYVNLVKWAFLCQLLVDPHCGLRAPANLPPARRRFSAKHATLRGRSGIHGAWS